MPAVCLRWLLEPAPARLTGAKAQDTQTHTRTGAVVALPNSNAADHAPFPLRTSSAYALCLKGSPATCTAVASPQQQQAASSTAGTALAPPPRPAHASAEQESSQQQHQRSRRELRCGFGKRGCGGQCRRELGRLGSSAEPLGVRWSYLEEERESERRERFRCERCARGTWMFSWWNSNE